MIWVTCVSETAETDTHWFRNQVKTTRGTRGGRRVPDSGPTRRGRASVAGMAAAQTPHRTVAEAPAAAPWRGRAACRGALCEGEREVGAREAHAPTLSASTSGCSSGSCSPGSSLLFSHFDTESVLWSDALRWILSLCSLLCAGGSRLFAVDPNLVGNI